MKALLNPIIATTATALFVISLLLSGDHRRQLLKGGKSSGEYDHLLSASLGVAYEGLNHTMSPQVVPLSGMSTSGLFRENLKTSVLQPARQIGGVGMQFNMENGAVRAQVWMIFNEMRNSEWWRYLGQESLGSFLLREGGAARIDKLAQYGYEPFTIRAVSARPKTIRPDQLTIRNQTQALEVVEIKEQLGAHFIKLRNRSDKGVVAYQIWTDCPGVGGGIGVRLTPDGTAPPGAIINVGPYRLSCGSHMAPQEPKMDQEQRPAFAIRLAVLSDGSFEGAEAEARKMFIESDGRRKELSLALPMLKQLLDIPVAQLPDSLEKLKTYISEIPQEEKRLRTSKQLSLEQQEEWLYFETGMYDGRNLIQYQIEQLQGRLNDSKFRSEMSAPDIRDYIRRIIEDCEKRMNHPV
jgi:hypothetical protein